MRLAAMLLAVGLSLGCDIGQPTCIVIPGPDVEAGLYRLEGFSAFPDSLDLAELPYGDASDLTIELSSDRSEVTIRYVRGGESIEETWSVRIL